MRVLVTGKNGQLGQSIKKIVDEKKITNLSNYNFTFIGREELNLEYIDSIRSYFDVNEFNIIINCAAYTLSLIHISEPTRRTPISYAVFCLKKVLRCCRLQVAGLR